MSPIRSRKYLAGSRGQPCKLRIVGVCTGDVETTVPAHIRDRHTGRSIKASDLSVADSCFACHEKFDGRAGEPLPPEEWLFYALRGLQDTLESREARGLLVVPRDAPKPLHERKTPQRKPPELRAKISSRGFAEGPSRPIPSRPFPSKREKAST